MTFGLHYVCAKSIPPTMYHVSTATNSVQYSSSSIEGIEVVVVVQVVLTNQMTTKVVRGERNSAHLVPALGTFVHTRCILYTQNLFRCTLPVSDPFIWNPL